VVAGRKTADKENEPTQAKPKPNLNIPYLRLRPATDSAASANIIATAFYYSTASLANVFTVDSTEVRASMGRTHQ